MKVVMEPMPSGIGPGEAPDVFFKEMQATFPEVQFVEVSEEADQIREVADAEVYYGWPSRDVFLAGKNLKWIHCPGTGIDQHMAIPELVASDIPITNAREPHVAPMADHVFGFIIVLAHKLHWMWDDQKARNWRMYDYGWKQLDLEGSTLGIVAMGNIGRAVAKRAQGFSMNVYAVDKFPRPSEYAEEVWGLDKLDDLLAISDWLVVTAPITDETRGMIGKEQLRKMKPGSHMIIISRGGIVDEFALGEAIESGHLAGAGVDAFDPEPPVPENPLWDNPNVVMSPHASAFTPGLYIGRRNVFKENFRRYLAGEPFLYVCDKKLGY